MLTTRRRAAVFGAAVAALVCLDQISKLLVRALVPADQLNKLIYFQSSRGWAMLHLHPTLHDRFPLPLDMLAAVLAMLFLAVFAAYFKYERAAILRDIPGSELVKSSPRLTLLTLIFAAAGLICSTVFDAFLWGGSLDFLCFERAKFYTDGAEPYTVTSRLDVDLKDVFLWIAVALFLVRSAIFKLSQRKLEKSDRRLIAKRENHIIKSIREVSDRPKKADFKPLEPLMLAGAAIVATIVFGYIIYIMFIWVIIPVATEISPAIDEFLTKIGDTRDTGEIYGFILHLGFLIGFFPAMAASNASIRRRERSFTHDTGGMILTLNGIKYHAERYALADLIGLLLITVLGYVFYVINFQAASPFAALYTVFGPGPAVLLSFIFALFGQLFGIVFAQKSWRASFFYGG